MEPSIPSDGSVAAGQKPPRPSRAPGRPRVKEYKRVFKACLACRKSKSKCDVPNGSETDLFPGPCFKCQREGRSCEFPAFRGSRRPSHLSTLNRLEDSRGGVQEQPGATSHENPITAHSEISQDTGTPVEQHLFDSTAVRTVVTSSNTALGILFDAVKDSDDSSSQHTLDCSSAAVGSRSQIDEDPATSFISSPFGSFHSGRSPRTTRGISFVKVLVEARHEVLAIWQTSIFIREGLFSAQEAVTYLDLFFQHCAPQSPAVPREFAEHCNHYKLLKENQLLAVTFLLISSRLHVLPGLGGLCRAHDIHNRLWIYAKGLINSIVFGFQGSSSSTGLDSLQSSRTTNNIAALILLTEWPPRAIHSGLGTDKGHFDLIHNTVEPVESVDANFKALYRWKEEVLEPKEQVDRMSWMVLGVAVSLAHRIDTFKFQKSPSTKLITEDDRVKRFKIQLLLCNYTNRLAGREGHSRFISDEVFTAVMNSPQPSLNDEETRWLEYTIEWTKSIQLTDEMVGTFFSDPAQTRELLATKRYRGLLEDFKAKLKIWYDAMLDHSDLLAYHRNVLLIEYQHIRMYINSLAVQAVVDRAESSTQNPSNGKRLMSTQIFPEEATLIAEVVDAGCQSLNIITSMEQSRMLRYAPDRIYLRAVAASIFLVKASSLGGQEQTLTKSLEVLNVCARALKASATDELHIGYRYGTLLDRHVRRLRREIVNHSATRSSAHSKSSFPAPLQPENQAISSQGSRNPGSGVHSGLDESFMNFPSLDESNMLENWISQPFDPSITLLDDFGVPNFEGFDAGFWSYVWSAPRNVS